MAAPPNILSLSVIAGPADLMDSSIPTLYKRQAIRTFSVIDTSYQMQRSAIHVASNIGNDFICSFKEFLPFCHKLFYFSSFKDFKSCYQVCN